MFTRHRLAPANRLDSPHAMGTDAFSPQRGRVISSLSAATIAPFDSFAALSPSGQAPFDSFAALSRSGQAPFAYHGRKPTNLRVRVDHPTLKSQRARF